MATDHHHLSKRLMTTLIRSIINKEYTWVKCKHLKTCTSVCILLVIFTLRPRWTELIERDMVCRRVMHVSTNRPHQGSVLMFGWRHILQHIIHTHFNKYEHGSVQVFSENFLVSKSMYKDCIITHSSMRNGSRKTCLIWQFINTF